MLLASPFANISSRHTRLSLWSAHKASYTSFSHSDTPLGTMNTWLGPGDDRWSLVLKCITTKIICVTLHKNYRQPCCPNLSLVCNSYSCNETAVSTKRWTIHLGIHNTRRDDVTPPFLCLNVPRVYLDALMILQASWSDRMEGMLGVRKGLIMRNLRVLQFDACVMTLTLLPFAMLPCPIPPLSTDSM